MYVEEAAVKVASFDPMELITKSSVMFPPVVSRPLKPEPAAPDPPEQYANPKTTSFAKFVVALPELNDVEADPVLEEPTSNGAT